MRVLDRLSNRQWMRGVCVAAFALLFITLTILGLLRQHPQTGQHTRSSPMTESVSASVGVADSRPGQAGSVTLRRRARAKEAYGKLPLRFVENRGQLDRAVAYYVQGRGQAVYFTPQGVTFALTGKQAGMGIVRQAGSLSVADETAVGRGFDKLAACRTSEERQRWALKLDFVGANPHARLRAEGETPTVTNYFKGGAAEWRTRLKTYATLVYEDLWPGIDLVYGGAGDRLKYSFVVKPGADPDQIKLAWRGATNVKISRAGQLEVTTPLGTVRDERPVSFQDNVAQAVSLRLAEASDSRENSPLGSEPQADSLRYRSRHKIKTSFALRRGGSAPVYGFKVGDYDRSRTLVIDPVMQIHAGYVGGAGDDYGNGIAVNSAGEAFVTGTTYSGQASFPVAPGL